MQAFGRENLRQSAGTLPKGTAGNLRALASLAHSGSLRGIFSAVHAVGKNDSGHIAGSGRRNLRGLPEHRRSIAISGCFAPANRAASSKQPRFFRRWRRFGCFPLRTPLEPRSRCGGNIGDGDAGDGNLRFPQAVEKVRWTFSTAFTMPRFSARAAGRKAAAARRKRLLTQAFCRHSIQHEGAPGHRRGIAISGLFWAGNRAASSQPVRFFRRWRRFAGCPLVLPLQKRNSFPSDRVFRQADEAGTNVPASY